MPRPRRHDRLATICEAAWNLFSSRGYRRTRMSEVAAEAGVAPGTLYLYVQGKEALFLLLVDWLSDPSSLPSTLPVPAPEPGEITRLLRSRLTRSTRTPVLDDVAATRSTADIRHELGAIVDELYATIARNHRLLTLIERCAIDWPALYEVYAKGRRRFLRRLATYLDRRVASGQLAAVADTDVAARFVVESVGWMAWKRHNDADAARFDEEGVRETVRALVVGGLLDSDTAPAAHRR